MRVELVDGRRVTLRWIGLEAGFEMLETVVGAAIGDRLFVNGGPIG